jgi:Tol biopolymer transport system component/predicted Ser/Thr protein kinase
MIGRRLLHYEITEKLGEGGMGVVYKARDAHLDRFVAIKVLPPEKVADAGRKARFAQEAKAASALNHPNIVHVYDISSDDGTDFIAMEYVAGKTLDQIIPRKGMRLNDALKIAVPIADALARAHAAGIVHRDLKPANIMVDEHGLVKVLDFGLAKLTETALGEDEATRTAKPHTEEGTVVGTAAYMSPEQAEGKTVDARSDIFSFGAVLYEMVTGARAFRGDSRMSTLAAVLHHEPAPLPADTPHDLARIVTRCLRKQPERRLQTMADLRVALEEIKEESESGALVSAGHPQRPGRRLAWLVAAVLVVIAASATTWYSLGRRPPGPALRVRAVTDAAGVKWGPALSPDGKQIAFVSDGGKEQNWDIYVQLTDEANPRRLTTDPALDFSPAWSPDGLRIAFVRLVADGAQILIIPAAGGPERKLYDSSVRTCAGTNVHWAKDRCGIAWSPDGRFLTVVDREAPDAPNSIFLLNIETRERRRLTSPPKGWFGDGLSAFSPDGRTLAFSRSQARPFFDIYTLPLSATGEPRGEPRQVTSGTNGISGLDWTPDGRFVVFSSARDGYFSLRRVSASGGAPEPLPVGNERAHLPSLSRAGSRLAYGEFVYDINIWRVAGPGADASERQGKDPTQLIAASLFDSDPAYSPDGSRIAFASDRSATDELWVCDSQGGNRVHVSTAGIGARNPQWSPDGRRITFQGYAGDGVDRVYVIGAEGGTPRRLTREAFSERYPSWSRDGRWIYFSSDRGDGPKIWKAPAEGGLPVRITAEPGDYPCESLDGAALYYSSADGRSILRTPLAGGSPEKVLEKGPQSHWALAASGICLLESKTETGPAIEFFQFATGRRARIAKLPKAPGAYYRSAYRALSITPDARWIVWDQLDRYESDIRLAENFR